MKNLNFSANLGFLFREVSLVEAVYLAHSAGFDAVELHFPYETPASELKSALAACNLPLRSLNTLPGNMKQGDFGLCALPGRQGEAREAIRQAIDYAAIAGARYIHVMAGKLPENTNHDSELFKEASAVFVENLKLACKLASDIGAGILIEPMNGHDAPGYLLSSMAVAADILARVNAPNLKIMFDCYHNQIIEGNLLKLYRQYAPLIGHVQFAAVPDRTEPDHGEVDYTTLLPQLVEAGYSGFFGAEYRPSSEATADTLGWMSLWNSNPDLNNANSG